MLVKKSRQSRDTTGGEADNDREDKEDGEDRLRADR